MSQSLRVTLPIELRFLPTLGEYRLSSRPGRKNDCYLRFQTKDGEFLKGYSSEAATDPWKMRNELLALDDGQFKCFTNIYGRFDVGGGEIRWSKDDPDGGKDFDNWRRLIRDAMLTKRSDWPRLANTYSDFKVRLLSRQLLLTLGITAAGVPFGVLFRRTVLSAVLATISLDLMQGARFRLCARPDCKTALFKLTNAHERKYCSMECAHLVAVRANRARAREGVASTSPHRRKTNAIQQE